MRKKFFIFLVFGRGLERKRLALLSNSCFWSATRKKKKKRGFRFHAMADWLSDDALLAALASEPAPLHHLTGKGRGLIGET